MIGFLAANGGTIFVLLVLIAVITGIILNMVKDHRAGRSCTCGCSGCSKSAGCPHCASGKNNGMNQS